MIIIVIVKDSEHRGIVNWMMDLPVLTERNKCILFAEKISERKFPGACTMNSNT